MNFLAHLHLSGDDPGWLLGGILGDFIHGQMTPGRFPDPIQQGIVLHRKIDAFTDTHRIWKESKAHLASEHRRYAGIVIDVFYDHFLARHWGDFSDAPLRPWAHSTYGTLKSQLATLTSPLKATRLELAEASILIEKMAEDDWLTAYLDRSEIPTIIDRISRRSPRLVRMRGAGDAFEENYRDFESEFLAFYPEAVRMAEAFRSTP